MPIRIGPHVGRLWAPAKAALVRHLESALEFGTDVGIRLRALQVFVSNPHKMKIIVQDDEAERIRKFVQKSGITLLVHGAYGDVPWSHSPFAVKFIRSELAVCKLMGAVGLVIHLGKPDLGVVESSMAALTIDAPSDRPYLYFETPHVLPANSHYHTPEHYRALFRMLKKYDPKLQMYGVCIDTAHLWSCGVNLRSYHIANTWCQEFEDILAEESVPDSAVVFHFNDSAHFLGSGIDKHAPLLQGNIWDGSVSTACGLTPFVLLAERHNSVCILERNNPDNSAQVPKAVLRDDYSVLLEILPGLRTDAKEPPSPERLVAPRPSLTEADHAEMNAFLDSL